MKHFWYYGAQLFKWMTVTASLALLFVIPTIADLASALACFGILAGLIILFITFAVMNDRNQ